MIPYKNHHKGGQSYSLSPVATVEYIRTQMRGGSPGVTGFVKRDKNSDKHVGDIESSRTEHDLVENNPEQKRHGDLRLYCHTDGCSANCDPKYSVQHNNTIYNDCRNARGQDNTKLNDNNGMKLQEHQIFSNMTRQTHVPDSPNKRSESCRDASASQMSYMQFKAPYSSDSDSTFDGYRYGTLRDWQYRESRSQRCYIQQRPENRVSTLRHHTSEADPQQSDIGFREEPFVKPSYKYDDSRGVLTQINENTECTRNISQKNKGKQSDVFKSFSLIMQKREQTASDVFVLPQLSTGRTVCRQAVPRGGNVHNLQHFKPASLQHGYRTPSAFGNTCETGQCGLESTNQEVILPGKASININQTNDKSMIDSRDCLRKLTVRNSTEEYGRDEKCVPSENQDLRCQLTQYVQGKVTKSPFNVTSGTIEDVGCPHILASNKNQAYDTSMCTQIETSDTTRRIMLNVTSARNLRGEGQGSESIAKSGNYLAGESKSLSGGKVVTDVTLDNSLQEERETLDEHFDKKLTDERERMSDERERLSDERERLSDERERLSSGEQVVLCAMPDKTVPRMSILGASGSQMSMSSDITTAGSEMCCQGKAPTSTQSRHVFEPMNSGTHTPCSVDNTPLDSDNSKSQSKIKNRRGLQMQKDDDDVNSNTRAVQTLDMSNNACVDASNAIESRSLGNMNNDKRCFSVTLNEPSNDAYLQNEPSNDAYLQNEHFTVPTRKLTCASRNEAGALIQHTQSLELTMFPKIIKELPEFPGLSRSDISARRPKSAPDSGSNCVRKNRRKPFDIFPELFSLVAGNKGHESHHSGNFGLDSTSCQQSGIHYLNSFPDEISTCGSNYKETTDVYNPQSSNPEPGGSHSSLEIMQHMFGAKDDLILAPFAGNSLRAHTPGLHDSEAMENKCATKRKEITDSYSVSALRNSNPQFDYLIKERMKRRRFTDLSSSLFKYQAPTVDHGSKKNKESLSEDVPNYKLHNSITSRQGQLPRKGAPNRRYSLGIMSAKSAEIAAIYSRRESPTPSQGQPPRQLPATGSSSRRYSHGVMGAKSAEIAQVYSRHDYPSCKSSLQPGETDQQLQNSRQLLGNTVICSNVQTKVDSSQQVVNSVGELPPHSSLTPCPSNENRQGSLEEMSEAYCQTANDTIVSQTEEQKVSHNQSQHLEFKDEEFRSADVFLAELEKSCHGSRSPSSTCGAIGGCRNIHIMPRDNIHGNKYDMVINSRIQICPTYCRVNKLPQSFVQAAEKTRQSLPICSSHKLDALCLTSRRLRQEHRFHKVTRYGSTTLVKSDHVDDIVNPFRGVNQGLDSWCKDPAEDSTPTPDLFYPFPENKCLNTTVEDRDTVEHKFNRRLSGTTGILQETSSESEAMERRKGSAARNRNVVKGSVLISLLVETNARFFPSRTIACKFARRLFREGHIRSISGAKDFEDSAQLYMWFDLERTEVEHGHILTPASSSYSNSKSDQKPNKQISWQLIQDIRNKLLNRSETYNIVTSYNTFFQELEQDFGFDRNSGSNKKSPPGEGSDGWSQANAPYTSTLENKKDLVHSTDSSLDNQTYLGKFRGSKTRRKNSKVPSGSSSKGNSVSGTSSSVPHGKSQHLIHPQQDRRSIQQKHHLHQHHNTPSHQNVPDQQSVPDVKRGQANRMNTEHNLVSEERLITTNQNSQLPQLLTSDPANMNHKDIPHQQATMVGNTKSSKTSENVENVCIRHSESSLNRDNEVGNRRPTEQFNNQPQVFSLEMQTWLDPGISHLTGNQQWVQKNNRPEDGSRQVNGSRSRWPENSVNDGMDNGRRWPESAYSFSDNEKQLLEEMRRMKKEHQNVLRTYESRINKLMAKMHELRNIAEMLEHSSNKSSPYGILPGKLALLNILGGKAVDGKNVQADSTNSETYQLPPPLPPRPGKGSRVYPNKPIIRTNVTMKPLSWSRIILESNGGRHSHTVWHGMTEPKIDTEELQRLFSESSEFSEVNLYDDICLRRGRSQTQLVSIYDTERSQRIVSELRSLHCTLAEVTQAFMTLNCDGLHTDSFAELLELLTSQRELDQISHHTKKRGAGQLDAPEYLVFELSKIDHFRERLEFLRFKNKIQINLFEIDQQLRELQTACEEITSSVPLKHVLETILAIGNHMNAGTDRGQADGFQVDILTSLKDVQDASKQYSLLELAMRTYCLRFESGPAFGCPTRFRLPEPSNMRHAAQVSFEDIQRALKELKDELSIVRNKLETLSKREGNTLTVTLRAISENFLTSAVEVLAEEQKLLDDTCVQFWKTASFFSYDGQKSTPHEFFQIWASFLHDCKYYWKLAHRNLAKAKFNTDLTTKSQLSCSSLPEFSSLKSAMMKHVTTFQQDEMRTSKSQQLQHINSWIQSVGKYTMEMQSEGAGSSLDVKDYIGHHQVVPQGHERKQLQSQHQESELSASSPPYQNETIAEPRNSKVLTNLGRQLEQENKPMQDTKAMQVNKSRHNEHDVPQAPSSPKPINATPPNVLKPQATIHPALKLHTHSAAFSEFHLARSTVTYQANVTGMKHHRKNSNNYPDDNFGFEPLYESLSHYSQNHLDLEMNEDTNGPQDGVHDLASSGNNLSPDPDSIQKKNSNFFKSLLKRDPMRTPVHEERLQVSPQRNVSTPFSKVKHTFVHKFSGSGNAKNSNSDSPKNYNISHQNTGTEISNQPLPGASSKHDSYHITDGPVSHNNMSGDVKERDSADYQNLCFPDQSKQESLNHANTPDSLEVHPDHSERIFYREGHESFPSTISSLQSARGRDRPYYQGNGLYRRDVAAGSRDAFNKCSKEEASVSDKGTNKFHIYHNDNRPEPTNQSSLARIRAPIALGSNMSISQAYAQGAEQVHTQLSGNYDFQPPQSAFSEVRQEKIGLISNDRNISDTKWIKASPVPVYKAKVIPNYENQSKYDPRFEGVVRAQAVGMIPCVHVPQVSISSDVYRQELQKKSEQYVGGGTYPTVGLASGGSGSLRGSGSMGASYTILPPKPNHYQAFPVTLSQNTQKASSSPENSSHNYPPSSNTVPETSQEKNSNQTYGLRNNPENGEAVSTSDYSPKGIRHNIDGLKSNSNISSERKLEIAKGQSLPVGAERNRTAFANNFPAYRSSSAHSVLDRDNEFRQEDRRFHSAYARSEAQQTHMSRKDIGGKKMTATSHRDQSPMRSDGPQSVTSLIDRFEKGTDANNPGIGLLDISDKPPSMTSTPVVKRKNQGVTTSQPSHGKLVPSKSDGESHRSQSEETKNLHSQREITSMPGWPKSTNLHIQSGSAHASLDRHISNSHYHYMQSHHDDNNNTPHDQLQSDHIQHFSHNSRNQKSGQPLPHKPKFHQSETPNQHYKEQYHESGNAAEPPPQSQPNFPPGYDNIPQWHQQRQSPQAGHIARCQPQLPTVQPYNSFPTNSNTNTPENLRFNEDFYHSSKLTSSAFEHPHRVATKYGRQPGAMAVVKPTVMNI